MNRAATSEDQNLRRSRSVSASTIDALLLPIMADLPLHAQQATSLSDIARQARSQKQAPSGSDNHSQQVADELLDDHSDAGEPGGFKTFNAGDYRLWVPAPYKVEGHEEAGIVLSGPMIGMKHSIPLVGTLIIPHFANNNDGAHVVVGCLAPRETFTDEDAISSGLIGSLRLP